MSHRAAGRLGWIDQVMLGRNGGVGDTTIKMGVCFAQTVFGAHNHSTVICST